MYYLLFLAHMRARLRVGLESIVARVYEFYVHGAGAIMACGETGKTRQSVCVARTDCCHV